MAKYVYPAIFTKEENGLYSVHFPDLDSCYTSGDELSNAFEMAQDVLSLTLYNSEESGKTLPAPSDCKTIETQENEFVSMVVCDTMEYRKLYLNSAVKKTLTIPAWMNALAEKEGINFSQLLQDALKEKLHVVDLKEGCQGSLFLKKAKNNKDSVNA